MFIICPVDECPTWKLGSCPRVSIYTSLSPYKGQDEYRAVVAKPPRDTSTTSYRRYTNCGVWLVECPKPRPLRSILYLYIIFIDDVLLKYGEGHNHPSRQLTLSLTPFWSDTKAFTHNTYQNWNSIWDIESTSSVELHTRYQTLGINYTNICTKKQSKKRPLDDVFQPYIPSSTDVSQRPWWTPPW